ncbi:MAG: Uma2 family endonuclease [Gemmatimonadaceae bacterium]|nr:Uma2 family endonuclease [Gemmatimonadaceae bacterium]
MGMPTTTPRYWTVDDVWALPEDPRHRYEAVDGELLVSPSPRSAHQLAVGELHVLLHAYARETGCFLAFMAPSDVVVFDTNLVQPDLYLLRLPANARGLSDPKQQGLPSLVIEVVSPSSARSDRHIKRRLYQRAGIDYWLIDVEAECIEWWQPDAPEPSVHREVLAWTPAADPDGSQRPALTIDVARLMAAIGTAVERLG